MSLFISSGCCIMLAWMILILPLHWIIPALLAAFLHEAGHYIAILCCSGIHADVRFYTFSARIPLPPMRRGQELICALAGPTVGLLLAALYPVFPRLALCALAQSVYNLLPVYPLDGGRTIRVLADLFLPPVYADWLCEFLKWLFIGAMIILGIYAAVVWKAGLFLIVLALSLIIRGRNAKIPCKADILALQ